MLRLAQGALMGPQIATHAPEKDELGHRRDGSSGREQPCARHCARAQPRRGGERFAAVSVKIRYGLRRLDAEGGAVRVAEAHPVERSVIDHRSVRAGLVHGEGERSCRYLGRGSNVPPRT